MRCARLACWILALATVAPAQSVLIRVMQGDGLTAVANGAGVTINSTGAGQASSFTVYVTYLGPTSLTFSGAPRILGSGNFTITTPPAVATLAPNQTAAMEVQYLPTSGSASQSELDWAAVEQSTPTAIPRMVVLGLTGTAPDFRLNYKFDLDSNIVSVPSGGTLPFLETPISSGSTVTLILANGGSGAGQVASIAVSGDAFSLASAPLLPNSVASGASTQFQVRYQPKKAGTDTGTLTVVLGNGVTYSVNLTGRAIPSYLTYEILAPGSAAVPVLPNGLISVPGTPVGDKSKVFVRISNTSRYYVQVSAMAVSGTSYQLTDAAFTPFTMAPNDVQMFTLVFQPASTGPQTGKLRIGADTFDVTGAGVGPSLTYSYRSPAGVTTVAPLSALVFPSAQVGGTSSVEFTLRNTGSADAPIVSIGIVSDGKPAFTLSGLPPLPTAIAPDGSLTFAIKFTPLTSGMNGASLRINNDAFTLTGVSLTPSALPTYTLQGPTTVQPLDQPSVGLTLADSYPLNLTGTLTIAADSDAGVSDPSVLFISGTKTVPFTISAGTKTAIFANGSSNLRLQVGSVAGVISVTPTFATEAGMDLTPTNPTRLRMTMAAAAPKIYTLGIESRTANSFVLQVVGVTNTRSLAKLTVSFKGKSEYNFANSEYTQDLTGASLAWFNSTASATYGGQFVMQIPFTLSSSSTGVSPVSALESVSLTIANSSGASSVASVSF